MTDQELSFDESHAQEGPVTCARCSTPLTEYWSVDGELMCEKCMDEVHAEKNSSVGSGSRVTKAIGLGALAMLVGAAIWAGVAFATDREFALIAILLGWMVGKAVFFGSGNRGGAGYQLLAVVLTYVGIGAGMAPYQAAALLNDPAIMDSLKLEYDSTATDLPFSSDSSLGAIEATTDSLPHGATKDQKSGEVSDAELDAELAALDSAIEAGGKATPADPMGDLPAPLLIAIGLIGIFVGVLALPIISIVQGNAILGLIIYGVALFQAFSLTKRIEPVVSGPHQVGTAPA
jgi:hypothetical protein